jgi:2-amino-4-hydroxy-6-hydroxymethyldihydropteridine diphosphokinase
MVNDPPSEMRQHPGHGEAVFVALASNSGAVSNLNAALARLRSIGTIEGISSVYQTRDVSSPIAQPFFNAAVKLRSDANPARFKEALRQIESELGRRRGVEEVVIDLDVCLFGSLVSADPRFRVPHPLLGARSYMAVPVAECDPDFVHPETGEPLSDLADRVRRADTNTLIAKTATQLQGNWQT